jgi:hypothetical protein
MKTRALSLALALAAPLLSAAVASGQTCANVPLTEPLYAGSTQVGTVTVSNDTKNIYVTYNILSGFILDSSALQVATDLSGVPKNSKGDPQTSSFTFQTTNQPGVTTYSYTAPLAVGPQTPIVIVAQGVVQTVSNSCGGSSGSDDDGHHSYSGHDSYGGSNNSGGHGGNCVVQQTTCGGGSSSGSSGGQRSLSGHSSSYGSSGSSHGSNDGHGDDHHGDDHHGDDHHGDDDGHNGGSSQCCGPQQVAFSGDQIFSGPAGAVFFDYTVNCGQPE